MFRRYWLPILGVVGLILTGEVQAQAVRHDARSYKGAAQGKQQPKVDAPPAIPLAVQSDIHSIARALVAANDRKPSSTDERNTKAQETVANWTPALFFLGFAELLLTGSGVWLVYRTLVHTRRAADAAYDSVIEARAAIGADRAWLTYGGLNTARTDGKTDTGVTFEDGVKISVLWKNTGRSPALKVKIWMNAQTVPWESTSVPTFIPDWKMSEGGTTVLGPGEGTHSASQLLWGVAADAFHARKTKVVVYSAIRYFDAFNPTHIRESEACLEVSFVGYSIDHAGQKTRVVDGIPKGPQNTAS